MIIIATYNQHKVDEIKDILQRDDVKSLKDLNFKEEIAETGNTFEQNSLIKAQFIQKYYPNDIILSDDSGLCVIALNHQPGVYSARYASNDNENQDLANNQKLLKVMENITDRRAYYMCCLCLIMPYQEPRFFAASLKGSINTKMVIDNGFGYDPLFILEDNRCLSQLSIKEKNQISHRYQALLQVKQYLKNNV